LAAIRSFGFGSSSDPTYDDLDKHCLDLSEQESLIGEFWDELV
jgi:hypothetical protein